MNRKWSEVGVVRLVQPLAGKRERAVKSRNGCQGLALFGPAATPAVTQQPPEREGSGGVFF